MDQEDLLWFITRYKYLYITLKKTIFFDAVVKRNTLTFSFCYSNYLCPSNFWNFLFPKHVLTSFLSSLFIRRYFCKITSQLLNNTSLHYDQNFFSTIIEFVYFGTVSQKQTQNLAFLKYIQLTFNKMLSLTSTDFILLGLSKRWL